MPLKTGTSKKTIESNISELIDSYKENGKIGSTTPKDMKHARKIATAIAYSKAKKNKKKAINEAFETFVNSLKTKDNETFIENTILKGFHLCFENIDGTEEDKISIDTTKITPDELTNLQDNLTDLKTKKDAVATKQKEIEQATTEMNETQNEPQANA